MAETPKAQQMPDQEMIARIGRRDQSAFSALYDRLSGPLYSLAMKMLGDPAEAQDALQDVFVQIWSRAGTYDPEQSSVFSWTVLLTRSRVIDRLRARGRRSRVVFASTEDAPSAFGNSGRTPYLLRGGRRRVQQPLCYSAVFGSWSESGWLELFPSGSLQ
jgi:DNA-directed RNA polymerase specialized sigma24 family protein